jgi:cleavage and polyadenylation specificity factor subunit 1
MVLETKEELELVTDKLNFETNYATICAGNLMGNSRIVQIHKRGLRIMNGPSVVQDITHEEIASHLPSSEATNTNTKKMEVEIVDACVCDPFVFLLTSDKRFCLLERNEDSNQSGKPMKFSDKVRLDIASMSIIHNRCNYFESGEDDSHLAFLCDSRGDLEIVTLPNFTTVFKTKMVYQGYNILHARDSLDDAEMNLKKPQTVVTQIDCQVDRLSNELWVCMMTSDGFLYVYKLERNESNDAFYFTRKNILNEVLLKAASASAIPRKLIRIENVNSHYGYFVTGEKPLAIFFNQGQVRILSAFKDGPITSFTPFHNVNCKHGFVFATQSGDVNVCNLNDRVSTKFDWCVESMPVKGTVHKVTYSAEAKVLAAIVSSSIPYRQRKPEASGGDAHATNVYAAQEAALASSGKEEAYEVQLISPETFETLWTHLLAPGELALSISSVYIKNQTDQSVSSMLAVGTAFPRGEDYPCRGNIHFFKIEKQDIPNAEVGQPSAKWGGSLITSKDFRGAPGGGGVHVVSSLDGHLLVGIGIKVLMFKWNGEVPPATPPGYPDIPQLEQCGFFDSTLFASSLATVKKFVLSGDRMKGINFLRWLDRGNEQKVLQQLSTDYEKPPIHHVQFLIDGSTLTLMGIDMQGNIRIYAFDPADPGSFKGKKLLNRAIFYSGGRVSRMVRINPKASSESQAAVTVSRKIGVCISSFTASLAMLLPLDETTFKRLRSLQKRLITSLVQPAGLNPNAYRHGHYVDSTSGPLESSDNVLDGNVVWKFLNLTVEEQHKLAKLIGSRRETILSNLKELSIGMSVY